MSRASVTGWRGLVGEWFQFGKSHRRAKQKLAKAIIETLEPRILLSFVVSTLSDGTTSGTLRYEIEQADIAANSTHDNETVTFTSTLSGTIDLNLGALAIDNANGTLTIQGPGASSLAINGQDQIGVFSETGESRAVIEGLTIKNGSSYEGGGIDNAGTLTITGCTVTGNTANAWGGGIYNGGSLTINNSTVSNNTVVGYGIDGGGGIYNSGEVTISNSTISGNSGGKGGGLYNYETATINNSTISGNSASVAGGGLYNSSSKPISELIVDSTITGNQSAGNGGGIANYSEYSAGTYTTTIENSTISGNSAGGNGGGIANYYSLNITNCTFAENSAYGDGGGLANNANATITDSTIALNSAAAGAGIQADGTTLLHGTIVADNDGGDVGGTATGGYNLIGDGSGDLSGSNNLVGGADLASIESNHGGQTDTFPLLSGSSAIGHGSIFNWPDGNPITTDQRGYILPAGVTPDMGSYQTQAVAPLTVAISGNSSVVAGTSYTLNLSAQFPEEDQNSDHVQSWTINWGDGTTSNPDLQTVAGNPFLANSISETHTYAIRTQPYNINATATDEGGFAASSNTLSATCVAPPAVSISGSSTVNAGSTYTLTLSGVESTGSTNTISSWTINWGDGTSGSPDLQKIYGNPSAVVHSFPVQAGQYSITATATDGSGTYAALGGAALSVTINGGSPLQITGANTGTANTPVQLQAEGGNVSGGTTPLAYVWSVTEAGNTVATGDGVSFSFIPSSAGLYSAKVTAIGDPAGPSVATDVLTIQAPVATSIPINGSQLLEIGQFMGFSFDQQTVWNVFGTAQVTQWQQQALEEWANGIANGNDNATGGAGPTYQWIVLDPNNNPITPMVDTNPNPIIFYGNGGSDGPPSTPDLLLNASLPGTYTIQLQIAFNGTTYFQNSITCNAVQPAPLPQLSESILPDPIDQTPTVGDDAAEDAAGILVVSQVGTNNGEDGGGDYNTFGPAVWSITQYNPDLSVDTSWGNGGSITANLGQYFIDDFSQVDHEWAGKGLQLAVEPDGKFLVAASFLEQGGSDSPAKDADDVGLLGSFGGDDDPSGIDNESAWIVAQYDANGTLDTSFAANSEIPGMAIVENPNLNYMQSMIVEPNGQILLGGSGFISDTNTGVPTPYRPCFAVARLNSDGTLDVANSASGDPGFGAGGSGFAFIPVASDANLIQTGNGFTNWGTELITSMVVQPNGDIVAGGITSTIPHVIDSAGWYSYDTSDFALIRLTSTGQLDNTFNDNTGSVITSFSPAQYNLAWLSSLALDSEGNIVAMGSAQESSASPSGDGASFFDWFGSVFALARYSSNGTLDTSFGPNGSDGLVISDPLGGEFAYAGTITSSGEIVLAGETYVNASGIVAGFNSNGTVDTTFGTNGYIAFNDSIVSPSSQSYFDEFRSIIALSDNDIFVFGSAQSSVDGDLGGELVAAIYQPEKLIVDNLLATATPSGPVNLTWQNGGDAQDGFEILRSSTPDGLNPSNSVIAYVGSGVTTYTDSTVLPNTTYYYQVIAFNTNASSGQLQLGNADGYSNIANATTAPIDTSYVLQEIVQVPVNTQDGVSSTTILQAGVTYEIIASGLVDLGGPSNELTADANYAYGFTTGPAVRANSDWTPAQVAYGVGIDDGADTSSRYPYWGPPSTTADNEYAIMYTPSTTGPIELNFHDDYYPDNSEYPTPDPQNPQAVYPMQVEIYRALPSSPGNLVAMPEHTGKQVNLSWTNTGSVGAVGSTVIVQRALSGTSTWQTIAALPSGSTSYSDTTADYNQEYLYQVYVQNSFGQSAPSNMAYAVIANLPPVIASIPAQVAYLNVPFLYSVNATDPQDGKTGLTYSINGGAPDMVINATTGQISGWTPTASELSFYGGTENWQVTVTVTDSEQSSSSTLLYVQVAPYASATISVAPHVVSQTSNTITLSTTGTDASDGADIAYTWETVSQPGQAGIPIFSANGTNAAATTVVTVYGAGNYQFKVIMDNGNGWPAGSQTSAITVGQTIGSIDVTPISASAIAGSTAPVQFSAQAYDQFGEPISLPPSSFNWSFAGGSAHGTISSSGAYTAPLTVSGTPSDTINATVTGSSAVGVAAITVTPNPSTAPVIDSYGATPVNFTQLQLTATATDPLNPGSDSNLTYSWQLTAISPNAAVATLSDNDTNSAKTTFATIPTTAANSTLDFDIVLTVTNAIGQTTSEQFSFITSSIFTQIAMTPQNDSVGTGVAVQYSAVAEDQYGRSMSSQPSFNWTVTDSNGDILATGSGTTFTYTPTAVGQYTVTAGAGAISGTSTLDAPLAESFSATAMSPALVSLTWNADPTAQYYQVFRDTSPGFTPSASNQIADSLTNVSFDDDTVSAGTTYYYQIYAIDSSDMALQVGASSATADSSSSALPQGFPTNVNAMGVNDLEIFVSWTYSQQDATGFNIEIAQDGTNNWYSDGLASAASRNYIIRGYGPNGGQLLQESQVYDIRVLAVTTVGSSQPSSSTSAQVSLPSLNWAAGDDVIVVFGGNSQQLDNCLLAGVSVGWNGIRQVLQGMNNNNSVGEIWCDLVNDGFNAFLTPDPHDGGASAGSNGMPPGAATPVNQQDLLNNDGSGWLYFEIQHELHTGIRNIGLIGYSHGGGMAANFALRLKNDSSTPTFASVEFSDTIDAVEYGTGPDTPYPSPNGWDDPLPLQLAPNYIWSGNATDTFNYYETMGWPIPYTAGFLTTSKAGWVHGTIFPNATNTPFLSDNHSTIAVDQRVLNDVEADTKSYFGQLSS